MNRPRILLIVIAADFGAGGMCDEAAGALFG